MYPLSPARVRPTRTLGARPAGGSFSGTRGCTARIAVPRLWLSREPVASFGLAGLDIDPASALQDWLMKKQVRPWPLLAARRAGRPHDSGAGCANDKPV